MNFVIFGANGTAGTAEAAIRPALASLVARGRPAEDKARATAIELVTGPPTVVFQL